MARIIIGGDICPTKRDIDLFRQGDSKGIFNDLLPLFDEADYIIANLETPIIEKETPIFKSGNIFGNPPEILGALKSANITCLNLSNNHINDHGSDGIGTTLLSLKKVKFDFFGAGNNEKEAREPFLRQIGNTTIGLLSYCEHEYSFATEKKAGANPLNLLDFIDTIELIRETCDLIILLYHGGKENYILPSPKQHDLCNFFISRGVDIVISQHSHTIGLVEKPDAGGLIIYGQGNFVFDPYPLNKAQFYKGFLLIVEIENKREYTYSMAPYVHQSLYDKNKFGIRKLQKSESELFFSEMNELQMRVKSNPELIVEKWKEMCSGYIDTYLSVLHGHSRFERKLNEKLSFLKLRYSGQRKALVKNFIQNETHREMLDTILDMI